MQDRTFLLLAIRPNLNSLDKDLNTKEIETFQNDVVRPILKFQNDLLLSSMYTIVGFISIKNKK